MTASRSPRFYLGRGYDPARKAPTQQPLLYDPADLTTHAVVTGMTGSGKTGLCITLLEEAALQNIPALIIDPKGDLTNLLLHFPNLAPQDFQPWIDPEMARRAGKSLEQAANEAALAWRDGLQTWGIGPERLQALQNAVQFAVYTPGSDAGIPVDILASLSAPDLPWEGNRETLREKISSAVTALLGLVGLDDIDPLSSREHILLANIFENAWRQGNPLDLAELILQAQNPPFDKLGAFPLETFFPAKERTKLAMQLNNILAAPAFEAWREGQPLDVPALLFTPDGRPRHSIFYLAHLSEGERMFFVTLLLAAVETWMRAQPGAASLRAILYMDELFGYLPPQANPPSKKPLLRLLKQARAFGLGLLLATQNPVDLDYKALSNAGAWFIGKLQTEQDKNRLLDGLESAAGGLPRAAFDKLISSLGKRVFLLHNVHASQPLLFQTRWAMNFLAGPLTRQQIPALNELAGAAGEAGIVSGVDSASSTASKPRVPPESDSPVPASVTESFSIPQPLPSISRPGSLTRPPVPAGVGEYFLPANLGLTEAMYAAGESLRLSAVETLPDALLGSVLYRPALLAVGRVRFLDRKYGVDTEIMRAALVEAPDRRGMVRWEEHFFAAFPVEKMEKTPAPQARFETLDAPLNDARQMAALQRDFSDWLYRTTTVKARVNEALKVYAGPDVSSAEFMQACAETARAGRDAEIEKVKAKYERQIKALEDRLLREERELEMDKAELQNRKIEELGTLGENLLGGRRVMRRVSTSLTKRRMTEQAKAEVEESVEAIAKYKQQLAALQAEQEAALAEVNDRWGHLVNDISEVTIAPKKTDIFVECFGVAWMPFYLVESGGGLVELPAFEERHNL